MIDKSKFYKFIYSSVSFQEKPNFAQNLLKSFPVEIPYLDLEALNPKLKDSLDSYFYIEDTEEFNDVYKEICRKFPKISFLQLGRIRGNTIYSFFNACMQINEETIKPEDYIKLVEGEYKNLIAKTVSVEKDIVTAEFPLLGENRQINCPLSDIVLLENYAPLPLNSFRNFEAQAIKRGNNRAAIIDGNNCLLRCMHNTPNKYNSQGEYIGGFMGFFFSLLKVKEFFPEYQIYVVFENPVNIPQRYSEKVKKAFLHNWQAGKLFAKHAGFTVCSSKTEPAQNVIGTLVAKLQPTYKDILIYSTNEVFFPLINDNVSIYFPKITYRGHSEFLTQDRISKMFGFKEAYKIKWALAIHGKTEIPTVSISDYFIEKIGPKQSSIRYIEYSEHIFKSTTDSELLNNFKNDLQFQEFTPILQENLKKFTIDSNAEYDTCKQPYNEEKIVELLETVEMYKEIELLYRTGRILRGWW